MTHPAEHLVPLDSLTCAFYLARAEAIAQYTSYERALAHMCAHLMGTTPDYAGQAFFRINNSRARIAMLSRLLKKRHGSKYNLFWNSMEKLLPILDDTRNKVVHWTLVLKEDPSVKRWVLWAPNYYDRTEDSEEMALADLLDFMGKCNFFSRLISSFHLHLQGVDLPYASPDIFLQAATYPPPSTHPLAQIP